MVAPIQTVYVDLPRCAPTPSAAPTGAQSRQIRQAKRELAQLLDVPRDSPTMRIKIQEAKQTLAQLEAQMPAAVRCAPLVAITEQPSDVIYSAPARPITAPPPRLAAPPQPSLRRGRISPLQQMRDKLLLASIAES